MKRKKLIFFSMVGFLVLMIVLIPAVSQYMGSGIKPQIARAVPFPDGGVPQKLGDVPSYDTGWHNVGTTPAIFQLNHNLNSNTAGFLVDLTCRDEDTTLKTYDCTDNSFGVNAHWYDLTTNSIKVWIENGNKPDQFRLRIYQVGYDYSSGWHSLGTRSDPISVDFTHNLGVESQYLHVELDCWDSTSGSTSLGLYDCTDNIMNVHARWFALTNNTIKVMVRSGNIPAYVRVRIYQDYPSYNSLWTPLGTRMDPTSISLLHSLNGDADDYFVSMDCQDDSSLGVYDCRNNNLNTFTDEAHWYDLTNMFIRNFVISGSRPDSTRIRI